MDEQALYRQIGGYIRDARKAAGITQDELASAVGMSRTSIVNIEHGRQRFLVHFLVQIAGALRVSPQKLLPSDASLISQAVVDVRTDRGYRDAPDEIRDYLLKEFERSLTEGEGNGTPKADS